MDEVKIYTVTVGSKMHGLDNESSDTDIRYIRAKTFFGLSDPFQNSNNKTSISKEVDEESWELRHFARLLTKGNPTCYEVINSDIYEENKYTTLVKSLLPASHNSNFILNAHLGYCDAQIALLSLVHKKIGQGFPESSTLGALVEQGELPESKFIRVVKSTVAGYRVLAQGRQLLETGNFCPKVKEYSPELHKFLMDIKNCDASKITLSEVRSYSEDLEAKAKALKDFFHTLPEKARNKEPNYNKIRKIVMKLHEMVTKEQILCQA